jgi:ABC-type multidrug transport system fused ATPase/permease subunit
VPGELGVSLSLKRVALLSWRMLTAGERAQVVLLSVAMAINGLLQSFSLAALLPFIGLILDPTAARGGGYLGTLSRWFGNPEPARLLVWCSLTVFAAIVVKNAFHFAYTFWLNRLVTSVERRVAVTLLEQCMRAPYVWFLSKNTVILVKQVMGDVVIWARSGLKSILSLTSNTVTMASIVVFLVGIDPLLGGGLTVLGGLVTLAAMSGLRPSLRRMAVRKHVASNEAYKVVNHALTGAKDIKAGGSEQFFVDQFARHYRDFALNAAWPVTLQPVPGYLIETIVALIIVGIGLYASGHAPLRPELVALVAVYGVGAVRLLPVFSEFSATVTSVQAAVPAIDEIQRMRAELAALEIPGAPPDAAPLGVWDRLELRDVVYRYPGARGNALNGVSLVIEKGWRVGIVGRSGSGKTSLVDVLTGLLVATSGRVLIGRRALSSAVAGSWRRQIGYVSQHPFIADESLRFNVALGVGRESVDEARVVRALEQAAFSEVMKEELRGGLDAQLGERGVRLSGGQRQRVAIARALYRDARLLILDEATSALDSESERMIGSAFSRLSRDTTMVIVAHRLSTVKECDRILVLEKGEVVGYDTHMNLLQDCPLYRRFVELGDLSSGPSGGDLEPETGREWTTVEEQA